jgi:hypothetical protein
MNYLQTYKEVLDERDEKDRRDREAAKASGKRIAPTLPGARSSAPGAPPQLLESSLIASLLDSLFKFLKTTADQVSASFAFARIHASFRYHHVSGCSNS